MQGCIIYMHVANSVNTKLNDASMVKYNYVCVCVCVMHAWQISSLDVSVKFSPELLSQNS